VTKPDFLERQHDMDRELCNALIGATPENWKRISLDVSRVDEGILVKIESPEGHPGDLAPTPRVTRAVQALFDLYRSAGSMLLRASYELSEADGEWRYSARFAKGSQA